MARWRRQAEVDESRVHECFDLEERSPDVSDADAVANRGDRMSPRGQNSENDTNEAKFDETVIIIQDKEPVGVAANSGVDSGLDNGQEHLGESRRKGRADQGYSGVVAEGG